MKNIIGGQDISTVFEIFPGAKVKTYTQTADSLNVTIGIPEPATDEQMDALEYFHELYPGIEIAVVVVPVPADESADT